MLCTTKVEVSCSKHFGKCFAKGRDIRTPQGSMKGLLFLTASTLTATYSFVIDGSTFVDDLCCCLLPIHFIPIVLHLQYRRSIEHHGNLA